MRLEDQLRIYLGLQRSGRRRSRRTTSRLTLGGNGRKPPLSSSG